MEFQNLLFKFYQANGAKETMLTYEHYYNECVKHDLANHIRVPKISVNVDVTIDFE